MEFLVYIEPIEGKPEFKGFDTFKEAEKAAFKARRKLGNLAKIIIYEAL